MMRDFQSKVLGMLAASAEAHGFEAVVDYGWSNVGTLYVQPRGELRTLWSVVFNFQGSGPSGARLAFYRGERPRTRDYFGTDAVTFTHEPVPSSPGWARKPNAMTLVDALAWFDKVLAAAGGKEEAEEGR